MAAPPLFSPQRTFWRSWWIAGLHVLSVRLPDIVRTSSTGAMDPQVGEWKTVPARAGTSCLAWPAYGPKTLISPGIRGATA